MTQQTVKKPTPSPAQASAKIAMPTAKMSQTAYSAAESTQKAAQNVVNISTNAVREMLSSGTTEAQKAQEKMYEMGREGVENMARATDMCTRMMMEMMGICRDNLEAWMECCNVTSSVAKNMSSEMTESCNRAFSDSVEMAKAAFSCRTMNDVVELQNRAVKHTLDTCFNETNKLSSMMFDCCSEALEPVNERVAKASEQLCKVLSA